MLIPRSSDNPLFITQEKTQGKLLEVLKHFTILKLYNTLKSSESSERMYESEGGDKDCDMLSSGHGLAVTHMNSQKQWLPAQYLCKMNPIKFHMDWGETPETLPYLRRYCQLKADG